MHCTRCEGTGFLNTHQLPFTISDSDHEVILTWINANANDDHDVQICDCCGDGENWYGRPGEHYGPDDPIGPNGPYNGVCDCH